MDMKKRIKCDFISGDIEIPLFQKAILIARKKEDGHLTICKFTTNWKVGGGTSDSREEMSYLATGKTLAEALRKYIKDPMKYSVYRKYPAHSALYEKEHFKSEGGD